MSGELLHNNLGESAENLCKALREHLLLCTCNLAGL